MFSVSISKQCRRLTPRYNVISHTSGDDNDAVQSYTKTINQSYTNAAADHNLASDPNAIEWNGIEWSRPKHSTVVQ